MGQECRVLCVVDGEDLRTRLSESLAACTPAFRAVWVSQDANGLESCRGDCRAIICAAWQRATWPRLHAAAADLPIVALLRPEDASSDPAIESAAAFIGTDELTPRVLSRVLAAAQARQAMAAELRDLQHQYSTAFRYSRVPSGIATLDGRIESVNPALCELLSETEGALVGSTLPARLRPEDRAWLAEFTVAAAAGGLPTAAREVVVSRPEPGPLFAELSIAFIASLLGRPPHLFIRLADLTRGERRFRALVETGADATVMLAADGTILEAGPSTARVTGYAPREVEGRNAFGGVYRADLQAWETFFGRLLTRPGAILTASFRVYHRERGWCWMEGTGRNLLSEPAVAALVVNYRDIGERRRAEDALRSSEARYRALFEQNPQPMLVYEADSRRILTANEAAARLYGLGARELEAMALPDLFEVSERARMANLHATYDHGFRHWGEWRHAKRDGTIIDVELSTCAYHFGAAPAHLALIREVTERKRVEEQSRQAQKMEAIGRLAGGVAHDFNNMLTVISGYSDLILHQAEAGSQLHARMAEVQKAAVRAAGLTRQLLAFSRQQVLQPKILTLNETISGMATMLRRLIGEDVELDFTLDPSLGFVSADPSQLEQVVMNLAVNARDAMPQGGKLHFATQNIELDATYGGLHPNVAPGSYVLLTASDTGIGMDAATQAHIFEPFFSTKGNRGTGLGLSTVYGIVKQSNGYVWVYSEPGLGTTFKIYLPRAAGGAAAPAAEASPQQGGGAILLVENDADLRKLAAEILTAAGYDVIAAGSGGEALQSYNREAGRLVLLVTDAVLPGLGGAELAERVQQSALPVLFMSGYGSEDALRRGLLPSDQRFLQKPYSPQMLLAAVRGAIGAA